MKSGGQATGVSTELSDGQFYPQMIKVKSENAGILSVLLSSGYCLTSEWKNTVTTLLLL